MEETQKCSKCGKPMEEGYLAFYEPMVISRIVWQKEKPGYIRFKAPKDSVKVIKPPVLGQGDKKGLFVKTVRLSFLHMKIKTDN